MRLLVVEDENRMAALLRKGLEEEGYEVSTALDGVSGLELARSGQFDLVVLDIMLPGIDGFQIARTLRRNRDATRAPILMLTARDDASDIVRGLDLGADDYLTKPFSFEVLLARVRALLRRGAVPIPPTLRIGDLELNPATREARRGTQKITLTRTEYQLLECLMRRPGHVVQRDMLIEAVWGFDRDIESNTLDAFIRLLRAKIEAEGGSRLIHTVRGVGYVAREHHHDHRRS